MSKIDALLSQIEVFCASHGIAESTFGRLALNDGKAVARLRTGGTLTMTSFEKVEVFMATYRGRVSA